MWYCFRWYCFPVRQIYLRYSPHETSLIWSLDSCSLKPQQGQQMENWDFTVGVIRRYRPGIVIARSDVTRHSIQLNNGKKKRIKMRGWTHKRHPIARPSGRAIGCHLWKLCILWTCYKGIPLCLKFSIPTPLKLVGIEFTNIREWFGT